MELIFVNHTLREYYKKIRISHETSVARSPQQNGVIERRNRTLIEAARTMLIYAKAPLFLWAEAVATACYSQNRFIIRLRHGKTPYELLHDKLPDLSFFHDCSSGPALYEMTPATISSGLVPNHPPSTPFIPPSRTDWDILFQPLFDELLNPPSSVDHPAPEVIAPIAEVVAPEPTVSTDYTFSTIVRAKELHQSPTSSSSDVIPTIVHTAAPNLEHVTKWTKDHPLDNIIGELERPVSTRLQLHEQALFSMQEEPNEFERLEVWELVPRPDKRDSEDEDDTNDDGDNDDDGESDDHDDDSDDERTESDRHEIPDPNLTNVDQTELEEEEDVDDIVHTPLDYELTNDEKLDDEETMDDEEDNEVIKELYDDVNVNLGNDDTEMTDADQGALEQQNVSQESGFKQIEEDAHAILTPVIEAQKADEPVQSSSVSSDFTSKLLNLKNPSPADNEIASLMETSACHATAIPKITFDVSLIPGIVYTYLASKMKEAVDVAIQLQTNKLREEAQAKNQEFLNQVDSTIKIIIKDKVKGQVSKIMPKIEKYVTESLGAEVLVRSINQPQTSYVVAASLSEFELKKNLIDKMEANKAINRSDNPKNIYNALVESYNSNKDIITSYGNVVLLKRGRDDQDKDEDPSARSDQGTKRRKSGKDVEFYKDSRSKEKKSSSTSKDAS
ncbi:uncharacterized mitochondrial protein-like protein [Tanacetum coccineum]